MEVLLEDTSPRTASTETSAFLENAGNYKLGSDAHLDLDYYSFWLLALRSRNVQDNESHALGFKGKFSLEGGLVRDLKSLASVSASIQKCATGKVKALVQGSATGKQHVICTDCPKRMTASRETAGLCVCNGKSVDADTRAGYYNHSELSGSDCEDEEKIYTTASIFGDRSNPPFSGSCCVSVFYFPRFFFYDD